MKIRLLFATALAVGVMTVASSAQEAPARARLEVAKGTKAAEKKPAREAVDVAAIRDPVIKRMLGSAAADGKGVDRTTTAAVARTKPATGGKQAGKGGAPYGDIIARYAAEYGVPVSLAHAVIRVESNYRASARGRAGEVGLMQIKPSTARMMGYRGSSKGLYNPETNIKYGMKYLGKAHQLGGGSTCGTILKYNAGHGAKRMNKISSAYCVKVKRFLGA